MSIDFYEAKFLCISYIKPLLSIIFSFVLSDKISIFVLLINGKKIKNINIKNRIYYFYDGMVNIKDFASNLLKIDKKLFKNIAIYYIGYITKKINIKLIV